MRDDFFLKYIKLYKDLTNQLSKNGQIRIFLGGRNGMKQIYEQKNLMTVDLLLILESAK